LNWLLQRPTVSAILIGARSEEQLQDNLGAVGWTLDAEQVARLDAASAFVPPYPYYPYWNGQFAERTPPAVASRPR
jgi:aryl-alcohol dehydrogenase-like predicted oxidoreductase